MSWLNVISLWVMEIRNSLANDIPRTTASTVCLGTIRVPFAAPSALKWSCVSLMKLSPISPELTQGISPTQYPAFALDGVPPDENFAHLSSLRGCQLTAP